MLYVLNSYTYYGTLSNVRTQSQLYIYNHFSDYDSAIDGLSLASSVRYVRAAFYRHKDTSVLLKVCSHLLLHLSNNPPTLLPINFSLFLCLLT